MSLLSHLTPSTLQVLSGIYGALVLATGVVWGLQRSKPERNFTELRLRVESWWKIVVLFTLALVGSKPLSIFFLAFVSFLAFKEYLSLIPTRRADRRVLFWAYLSIPLQYYWVYTDWYGMFIIFIPVYLFLFLPFRMVLTEDTKGFLSAVGTLHWGLMTTVFSISHLAFLMALPAERNPAGGAAGLMLFIVLLTELNDIFQFLWGKSFGRYKIAPRVSPNKTVEGFLGGLVTTTLLAVLLAPVLTPIPQHLSFWIGPLIGIGGFTGDVVISAIKRDLAVKDSGSLIPGHGGILDRVDSLTYTAPLFFHFVRYFCY